MTQRYSKYKDSGIDWIGEIPEHWVVRKSKYAFTYSKGRNPKSFSDSESDNIYLSMDYLRNRNNSIQYIKETKDLYFVENNELLLLWDGANAGEFLNSKRGFLSSTMAHIKFNEVIIKSFGKLYSRVIEFQLRRSTVGMGIPHVSSLELENSIFLLPPLPEQEAIAQFLDDKCARIDQAVRIKEKQIDLLKEYRQIAIHQAVTKGLNDQVKMKDSGIDWIGEIPEHWEVKKNKELFTEINEPGNAELPILSVSIHTAVSNDELNEDENIRGKIRIEDKSNYKLVKKRDVVFNMMRAWQGAIGVVRTKGMVSPAYVVARPIQSVNSDFLEYEFRTIRYIQIMNRVSKGITDFRKRLYWNEFKQLETIIPPLSEQAKIVAHVEVINIKTDEAIRLKEQQIDQLKHYKNTLINEVVTGKIRVY
ncbi:restriction endonuclease subunit S [Flavihumibacter sp. RY-1]|uniref:Restriction endonuclease subunit S n=1 Tax=Flavihumibacter fluminis TaxID=2909236 RepID=A0ABS9BHP8_9BACT|nr:restriction endonuclease subunit S [Flavihumibacter fluminis]MCF1715242.1 restriction endonuclease subunit S [Flavihumibacter fluminis]